MRKGGAESLGDRPLPLMTIRALGMSHALEGGADLNRLFLAMEPEFGDAVAPMSTGSSEALTAILIDRKALPRKDLLARIVQIFENLGLGNCHWTEDPDAPGRTATLHQTG